MVGFDVKMLLENEVKCLASNRGEIPLSVKSELWTIKEDLNSRIDEFHRRILRKNCRLECKSERRNDNFFLNELFWGKAIVAYTMPQQRKKEESARLRGERDNIKFIDLGFGRWQVVRFRKARGR